MTVTPTIYDVARVAGVSIKTVSRVLNGETNVRPTTADAVREAITALDYHPNPAARSLRSGVLDTIGVVVDALTDPYFAQLVSVAEERAVARGMDVLVAATGVDSHRARSQIQRLVRRGVGGLLVAPFGDVEAVWRSMPRDRPVILVDRTCGVSDLDVVRVEDEAGARGAVEHLIAHGHERIAFLGESLRFSTVHDRLVGYCTALEASGLPVDAEIVETSCWTEAEAQELMSRMLREGQPPTAVFAATPMIGHGVIRALTEASRRDIALVVFGDFPFADLTDPPTTVVDQDPTGLAHAAMDRLLARLGGEELDPSEIVLPTRLVPRGSGELPPRGEAP